MSLNEYYFYFLITYEVCKKRKYYNRKIEKKKIFLSINAHVFYILKAKATISIFPSVSQYVCLSVCMYVCASCLDA